MSRPRAVKQRSQRTALLLQAALVASSFPSLLRAPPSSSLGILLENVVLCPHIFPLQLQETLPARKAYIGLIRGHGVTDGNEVMFAVQGLPWKWKMAVLCCFLAFRAFVFKENQPRSQVQEVQLDQ